MAEHDWPEWQLRQGGTAHYAHPVHPADREDIRRVARRLRAEGAWIIVGRERDDPPVPGYPGRYLTVRATWEEGDW